MRPYLLARSQCPALVPYRPSVIFFCFGSCPPHIVDAQPATFPQARGKVCVVPEENCRYRSIWGVLSCYKLCPVQHYVYIAIVHNCAAIRDHTLSDVYVDLVSFWVHVYLYLYVTTASLLVMCVFVPRTGTSTLPTWFIVARPEHGNTPTTVEN